MRIPHLVLLSPIAFFASLRAPAQAPLPALKFQDPPAFYRSASYPPGFTRTDTGFTAPDDSMAGWGNQSDIEAVTLTQWKMMRCPVSSIQGISGS